MFTGLEIKSSLVEREEILCCNPARITAHKHSTCHPERSRTRTGSRLKPRTVRATACGRDLETSFRGFLNCKLLFITNIQTQYSREIRMLRIRPCAMLRGFDCACAPLKMTPRGCSFCYPRRLMLERLCRDDMRTPQFST